MSDDVSEVKARRPSRFDRPKEPHDWRWVLGIVGRVLISVGVLMFAFVAYQLWGTGIQTAREQNRLSHEFEDMLETTVPLTSLPPVTTIEPVTTDPSVQTTVPAATTTVAPIPLEDVPPPVVTAPPPGGPLAQLDIPKMGLEGKIVVEGVTPSDLQDGPGHFPETPLPGQLGNSAIAGHRTSHGQPFHNIDELEPGDDITVTTLAGQYIYVVTGQVIVSPNDYDEVIPTTDPTKATLTLTSCHPARSTKQRIVVFAELDVPRSSPVTLPASDLIDQPASELPDETVPEETVPDETQPDETGATDPPSTESAPTEASTAPTTTAPLITVAPIDVVDPPDDSVEAFSNQWFSDPDAFAQVALWGFACIAVSLGAYAVSRRFRRNWVGALVGIVPFVIVLYFFFENVNRLLPPNI